MKTIFLLLLCSFGLSAQEVYPKLMETGIHITDLIPENWTVLKSAEGDLNKDGRKDLVFAIQDTNPKNKKANKAFGVDTLNLNPRILAVYFKKEGGTYVKQLQSNEFIPIQDIPTMEEPLENINITSRGTLVIDLLLWYSAGSWTMSNHTYTFRFQNNCFALIGYDMMELKRNSGNVTKQSINFNIKKIKTTHSNLRSGITETSSWKRIHIDTLKCLHTYGKALEWEFEEYGK